MGFINNLEIETARSQTPRRRWCFSGHAHLLSWEEPRVHQVATNLARPWPWWPAPAPSP